MGCSVSLNKLIPVLSLSFTLSLIDRDGAHLVLARSLDWRCTVLDASVRRLEVDWYL
jgi:hypothetical protein